MKFTRLRTVLSIFAIGLGVIAPILNASSVFAAGESYAWVNGNTIRASGGNLSAPADFTYNIATGLPGQYDGFNGVLKDKSGCSLTTEIYIGEIIGRNPGDAQINVRTASNVTPPTTCGADIISQYDDQIVQISGTRGATSAAMTFKVWSPKLLKDSPDSITIEIRQGATSIAKQSANKQEDTAFLLPDDQKQGFYGATFNLPGGEYTICSDNATILSCANVITGDYSSAACSPTKTSTCYNFSIPAGNKQAMNFIFNSRPPFTSEDSCSDSGGDFGWMLCPIINFLTDSATKMNEFVISLLIIETDPIFNTSGNPNNESSKAFRTSWGIFRNIAYALLLILALVMVISQIAGLDIFDAYTLRKMLPKLILAVIFIALSWPLLAFLFNASNDAAFAIMDLIRKPFSEVDASIGMDGGNTLLTGLIPLLLVGAGAAGVAYIAVLGVGGVLALAGTVLLAIFSAFVLLAARNVVAYLLIIAAPIAIICSAFEPFKKLFTLWKTLLITILISVPAIGALITLSQVAALIAYISNTKWGVIMAIIFIISGYALIWSVFKKLDTVTGQLGNVVGGATGKLQKGLSDYRSNAAKRRFDEAVSGRRNIGGAGWAAGLARRAKVASQVGGSWRGDAYQSGAQKLLSKATDEMVKDDNGRAGGDDDVMRLAQSGMSSQQAIASLTAQGVSAADARRRVRSAEANLGAVMGTDAMRVASYKALQASNTSYRAADFGGSQDAADAQMWQDAGGLIHSGLMTATDVAAAHKANKARSDRSGAGFASLLTQAERSAARVGAGQQAITQQEMVAIRREALYGSQPGAVIAGRHEAVTALAPQMRAQLQATLASGDPVRIGRELAAIAGRYDVMGQVSPQNAEIMAREVMSRPMTNPATGQVQTVQEIVDSYRNDPDFLTMRREYGAAAAQQAGAFQYAQAAAQGNVGQPPVIPGQGGSDRRLKTSIRFLTVVNGIKLYRFRYLHDDRTYVGVMAQDLLTTHPQAVIEDSIGFYKVDYGALGLRMTTLAEWEEKGVDALTLPSRRVKAFKR